MGIHGMEVWGWSTCSASAAASSMSLQPGCDAALILVDTSCSQSGTVCCRTRPSEVGLHTVLVDIPSSMLGVEVAIAVASAAPIAFLLSFSVSQVRQNCN